MVVRHICGACVTNKAVNGVTVPVTAGMKAAIRPSPRSRECVEVSETAKPRPYLHTVRAVAFTENHHLVGVDELLYPGFEVILPGFVFDGRHFEDNSTCLQRQASKDGWLEGLQGR